MEGNVLIYRSSTGKVNVSVLFNQDTFWLSQQRMAELFGTAVSTINYHLKQIDESGEVHLSDAIRKIRIPSEQWDEQGVTLYATEFDLKIHKPMPTSPYYKKKALFSSLFSVSESII